MLNLLASHWGCKDPRVLLAWQQRRPDITATLSHLKIKSLSINYSPTRKILLSARVFFFFQIHFYCGLETQPMNYWQPDFLNGSEDWQKNYPRAEKLQTFPQSESDTVERIRARVPTNRGGFFFGALREPDAFFLLSRPEPSGADWRPGVGQWSNTYTI